MNYLKHYCQLIRRAENRIPPDIYTEEHHIFPKSIYGNNSKIVTLTAREHFIAHLLLEKIMTIRYGSKHPNTIKARGAIYSMGIQHKNSRYINNRLYEKAKERWIETISGDNHWNAKLNAEKVANIRWYWNRKTEFKDITCIKLAKYFNISAYTMNAVLQNKTWKGINEKLSPEYNYLPLMIRLATRT
jgi:hypothetical protein